MALANVSGDTTLLIFACERCGKEFQVDERLGGKLGRCRDCRHIMRIPASAAPAPAAAPAREEPMFRLSPPEPPPYANREVTPFSLEPARPQPKDKPFAGFELIDDDDHPAMPASAEIERGLREMEEFAKNRREYTLANDRSRPFFFLGRGDSGPAGWLATKWRRMVTLVLRFLRWIDAWAYLISVPFLVLILFGIAVSNPGLVHVGAVVVVLANYGRFWADLLAFFVRPYKDGPMHGLAFLFPPYTLYYLVTRWSQMKPILRRMLTSCIPIVLVLLAYAYLPTVNPAVTNVHGVGPRLRAGGEELVKEIEEIPSAVKQIEEELPLLEKSTKPQSESKPPK